MNNTDKLIEVIVYAADNGTNWWEELDSISDGIKLIKLARHEEPDESQMICLLSALNADDYFEECTINEVYRTTLKKLYHEIKQILDE